MNPIIVLFPGLGADHRLFDGYDFGSIPTYSVPYLVPEENETIGHYAARLQKLIPPAGEYIFLGVSMGGLLAQEVAARLVPRKIILISTLKSEQEKPFYFRLLKMFPLHRVLPFPVMVWLFILLSLVFTRKTPEQRKLFVSMARSADPRVIRWGIDRVMDWKSRPLTASVYRIHGGSDLVFPAKRITDAVVVNGAQHFMVVTHRHLVHRLILQQLLPVKTEIR